jgi:hypothetical protein
LYDEREEPDAMTSKLNLSMDDADRLYDQYVRPLESSHRGQYVAVSMNGEVELAPTLVEAVMQAVSRFGKDNSIAFRVGQKFVGHVR